MGLVGPMPHGVVPNLFFWNIKLQEISIYNNSIIKNIYLISVKIFFINFNLKIKPKLEKLKL